MKTMFKPIGLAAAVAAVTAGYTGAASAQGFPERAIGNLGDLAIVPYYTVQDDWVTGVHIINTSDDTQVVKLRLRRALDSADALDFNLIMSPKDEWTGFLDNPNGIVRFKTDDTTCTAPLRADGVFEMPFIFREGAEEGYIEVIAMGEAYDEDQPIAVGAKHGSDGVPFDCASVATNFFFNDEDPDEIGVYDHDYSYQAVDEAEDYDGTDFCYDDDGASLCWNEFFEPDNFLKVSYFIRNGVTGTEMGGNAIHIRNFADDAWMTNQETGLFSGDIVGFDYPDLNGGPLGFGLVRDKFNMLRDESVLGVDSLLNDWSVNPALNVSTDWVVTMPGQYTMLDYIVWASNGFDPANCGVLDNPTTAVDDGVPQCDFRDIPVEATLLETTYNREEGEITPESGDLVISPQPPGVDVDLLFPYEVNVVEWTDGSNEPVLGSEYVVSVDPTVLGVYGWASLSVESSKKSATTGANLPSPTANSNGQAVCQFVPEISAEAPAGVGVDATPSHTMRQGPTVLTTVANGGTVCVSATGSVPIVGFAAWERKFPSNPAASYGRLIDHSFTSSSD